MGMVVRTNTMALNAFRQLGMNNSQVAKSLEKLASGYRINRAADDASGLAISEKMKAQIKGLETASANCQDGISLVQTAEGALIEVHNMLNRMVELATKSANGTLETSNREALQAEVDNLLDEIDRISEGTNFNGLKLLDGSLTNTAGINTTHFGVDTTAGDGKLLPLADPAADGVLGTNTVLHIDGSKPTTGSTFSIDLHDVEWDSNGADDLVLTVTPKIGGTGQATTITLEGAGAGNANIVSGGELAQQLADKFTATNNGGNSSKIDNIDFTVTVEGTRLVFTQTNPPILDNGDDTVEGNSAVTIAGASNQTNGTYNTQTTAIKTVEVGAGNRLASTAFTLKEDNVKEGYGVTIGKENYIFKTDKNSSLTGKNIIDVSDLVDDTGALITANLDEAMNRLTDIARNNTTYTVGYATGGKITLAENVGQTDFDLSTIEGIKNSLGLASPIVSKGKALNLQVGDTGDDFNIIAVDIADMSSEALGVNKVDITTVKGAQSAIDIIKAAIDKVSANRANMGAIQNRLEYTINNLDVAVENMSAANSRIRDTDMAKEMMRYTQMNVLTQSAQAMLAQANQQPQSILQLLQ